jgi:hypothetical protein
MPQLDVKPVDLLEQEQNCPTRGGELFTAELAKAFAPTTQSRKLLLVELCANDRQLAWIFLEHQEHTLLRIL